MKTQFVLGIAAVALSLAAVQSLTPALAYRGDPTVKGPNYTEERHQANVNAFEKGDYKAWASNMQGRGATRFVNEANFKEFAAAQLAAQKGDRKPLDAFRAKFGMGQGNGNCKGIGRQSN
ncbi:MAG: hypothetical protein WC686_04840 [Candidatus Shapirobacteria bacterium]|jgi:hypothetical protein